MNPSIVHPAAARIPRRRRLPALALCLSGGLAAAAVEVELAIGDIAGEDWQAKGIGLRLVEPAPGRLAVDIRIDHLVLPGGYGDLHGLQLACAEAVRTPQAWDCAEGRLSVRDSPVQAQDAGWQGSYRADRGWRLEIPRLAVAQGSVALALSGQDGAWSARVRPHRTHVAGLAPLGGVELPRGWGLDGRLSGLVSLDGGAAGVTRIAADLVADRLGYASPDGTQAAENLVLKAELGARRHGDAWRLEAGLRWPNGALYAEPLFVDADQGALSARLAGHWRPEQGHLQLDAWSLDLDGIGNVSGTGRLEGADLSLRDLTIAARIDDAGQLYQRLLQPFLIGTAADDMQVAGALGVVLHLDGEGMEQAGLELNRLTLEDRRGRFSLGRTDGSVGWSRSGAVPVSRLNIAGAGLYRIPTGGFDIRARFAGDRIELVDPVVVPLLGGSVALDSFVLSGALMAGERPRWEASASLTGLSLERLTQALEWPSFNGSVTGQLRDMRYADQTFSVGGGLDFSAFDGRIRVDGLRIRDPLGTVPVLEADATMRDLRLEALTETFSFGRIEGRLDVDLQDMQLVGWQPARFDLHLYTPENDASRHRISQRAVENLTELGSGVPAGLSVGLLSMFEAFRYDRIDLQVRLQGDVAELDGLARPDGGYYLVRGSGLPRIDVIGRNRSVAWPELVERLQQIQLEGAQIR